MIDENFSWIFIVDGVIYLCRDTIFKKYVFYLKYNTKIGSHQKLHWLMNIYYIFFKEKTYIFQRTKIND